MSEKTTGRKGNGHKGKERRKGAGTLEKRGRVYIARWTVNGKRYAQSTGTADRREAEIKLAEFVAPFQLKSNAERLEAFAGKLDGVKSRLRDFEESRPALKIADAWDAFIKSPNRKDTAAAARLRMCESWVKRLTAFMSRRFPDVEEVRGIGKEQAMAFAADGFSDCGNSTRNQAISFLRMMWRVMIADGVARIAANPWDGIQKRHETHTRRRELTVEELARVYALLEGEMRLLFSVGIYTGQRLGDCALLEWGQVDLLRRHISLIPRKTARKTGRAVIIPIHDNLLEMLLAFPPSARTGYVMPKCAKMYLEQCSKLSEEFMRVFRKAGINTQTDGEDGHRKRALVSFHSLRHTFVSLAANAGVPLAIVQGIVGHSTVNMTRHYFHESENALMSAVRALPSIEGDAAHGTGGAAMSARLRNVCALAEELTAQERAELVRRLQAMESGAAQGIDAAQAAAQGAQANTRLIEIGTGTAEPSGTAQAARTAEPSGAGIGVALLPYGTGAQAHGIGTAQEPIESTRRTDAA